MKRSIKFSVIVYILLSAIRGSAFDLEVDGFYYNVDVPSLTASLVRGDSDYTGNIEIPSSFYYGNREFTVVSIDGAFKDCENLISVSIPSSISSIKNEGFRNAINLNQVIGLNNVKYIGDYSFYGDIKLTTLQIASNLNYLGEYAFAFTSIPEFEFPTNLTKINEGLFFGCECLTEVEIPAYIDEIGSYVFGNCANLKYVKLTSSNNTLEIDKYAFEGCNLFEVDCDRNIVYGFYNANAFERNPVKVYKLGNNITFLDDYAFWGLPIKYMRIPKSIYNIPYDTFSYQDLNTIIFEDGGNLTVEDYWTPRYQASINYFGRNLIDGGPAWLEGDICFDKNNKITNQNNFIIGHGISTVQNYNNEIIYVGEDNYSFSNYKKVVFGKSVKQISPNADDNIIEEIICNGVTPPSGTHFNNSVYVKALVIVPTGSLESYRNHEIWGNFFNIIENDEEFNPWDLWCQKDIEIGDPDLEVPQIINTTAGSLSKIKLTNTKYIKIIGEINGSDLVYLKKLLGSNSQADWRNGTTKTGTISGTIQKLDLSEAKIIAGGSAYYTYKTFPGNDVDEIRQGYRNNYLYTKNEVIGNYLFTSCSTLQELWLPTGHSIEPEAFDNLLSLNCLIVSDVIPPQIDGDGWKLSKSCSVYVPAESYKEFQNSIMWNFLPLYSLDDYIPYKCAKLEKNNVFETFEVYEGDIIDINEKYGYKTWDTSTLSNNSYSVLTNEYGEFFAAYEGVSYCLVQHNKNGKIEHKTLKFIVHHQIKPKEIILNIESAELNIGDEVQLHATILPEESSYNTISWSTKDENIAVVSSDGLVKAVNSGKTVINASCGDVYAVCEIEVLNTEDGVDFIQDESEYANVYTVTGILLKENISVEDLNDLVPGIYIIQSKRGSYKIKK